MAPPEKKARTEEPAGKEKEAEKPEEPKDAEMKVEEKKPVEPPKELEEDAVVDKKLPRVKETPRFLVQDTTLNVMQSTNGRLLMALSDGGVQHLLAGARANVGLKGGRYMFELKIVEHTNPVEDPQAKSIPKPRNMVRAGFAVAGSPLVMSDASEYVYFDSDGGFAQCGKRQGGGARFSRGDTIAVLLNLDEASPNGNTVSLFKNGVRASKPQPLPESLKGKTLFPAVTFRLMTLDVHFGPKPMAPLPFNCRMVQDAYLKDATVATYPALKDGKGEVVVPVGLPDEGLFDWLDMFLAKNPGYTELSDRMVLDWAERSGVLRKGGYKARTSNDKPEKGFGIRELDDDSVHRLLLSVASLHPRNFVVAEVKGNLLQAERGELLARFPGSCFRRVGHVIVGEPTTDFKKRTGQLVLQHKQELSDAAFKAKKAEEKRKKLQEKRQKQLERAKKKAEKERKKKLEAARKAKEEAEKKKKAEAEAKKKKDGKEEKKDGEEEEPPKVELTSEEKALLFRKLPSPDLNPLALSTSMGKFTLPEKDEGFDEVRYEWSKGPKAQEYVKAWVLEKKRTTRVEELKPSNWFRKHLAQWHKALDRYQAKLSEHRAQERKKAQAAAAPKKDAAKPAAAKEGDEEKKDEKKEEEKEEEKEEKEEEKEEEPPVDFEKLDVFSVGDILNVGGGMPLFKDFQTEDWALATLRFELHLLAHAFQNDVEDKDRTGIPLEHLAFYYNKYYNKTLNPKLYGVEGIQELVALVNDAVYVTRKEVLASQLKVEMESVQVFMQLAEEARRYRGLRIALGEEAAQLKVDARALQQGAPAMQRPGVKGPKVWQGARSSSSGGAGWGTGGTQTGWTRGWWSGASGGAGGKGAWNGDSNAKGSGKKWEPKGQPGQRPIRVGQKGSSPIGAAKNAGEAGAPKQVAPRILAPKLIKPPTAAGLVRPSSAFLKGKSKGKGKGKGKGKAGGK